MTPNLPAAIFLMGPTAAGKTGLACALRQLFPVELISVDAAQVYRGLDIGTAKPNAQEQQRDPHRLIDILDPNQAYSAAQFCADAHREMAEITRMGRIPLLVGGTMFYFRALAYGLSELPSADSAIRAQLTEEAEKSGWPALHARLAASDPEGAARIHPHDAQRIQRGLEILACTGHAPSVLNRGHHYVFPYDVVKIAIAPLERSQLHTQIAARFQAMLKQGLVAEVEGLFQRGDLSLNLPSMRTVGYRQVWQYLSQELSYNEMVDRSIIATRQLAKRQLTWLRSDAELTWYDSHRPDLIPICASFIRQNLAARV